MAQTTEALEKMLEERKASHGDFRNQFACAQEIKNVLGKWGLQALDPVAIETMEMIAHKQSRIITGNSRHADHWRDIAGYATLIANLYEQS